MTILEALTQQLSGPALAAISDQLGVDQRTASQAIQVALPVLVGGLARNTETKKGAGALHEALAQDHDGSLMEDVLGYVVGGGGATDGDAILKHVLGRRRRGVESTVARQAGVDQSLLNQLLPILAPIVLAYLGGRMRQDSLDPTDLSSVLAQERAEIETRPLPAPRPAATPTAGGVLSDLLDRNRDGSATDEIAQMGMSILGSLLSGSRK